MTDTTMRSDFDVDLIEAMGTDAGICRAARVSNLGAEAQGTEESANLLSFLMRGRHGSPFEHTAMQWLISAPIFVWREFHRHRIASYNEQSSRWTTLAPVFYVPGEDRPAFRAEGTRKGEYSYRMGDSPFEGGAFRHFVNALKKTQSDAYRRYEESLAQGVAGEVSRMLLPVSIYSSCYVTMNVRALMNFLSLRTAETAQYEIRQVANAMAFDFALKFPLTHSAWVQNGRIAP